MKRPNPRLLVSFAALLVAGTSVLHWWQQRDIRHYLTSDMSAFVESFAAPPAADSALTRAELDYLLQIQATRTPAEVAAARADRKTEIRRFYGALGLDAQSPPDLPALEQLAERVEDDVRIHVRAVKDKFRRLRPYELEPRLEPCIDDVRGDLSYPSGHAAFAWAMAEMLQAMVPERGNALRRRADAFARQRMVCGVHFPGDIEAGHLAAGLLLGEMRRQPQFREDFLAAKAELRAALELPAN